MAVAEVTGAVLRMAVSGLASKMLSRGLILDITIKGGLLLRQRVMMVGSGFVQDSTHVVDMCCL